MANINDMSFGERFNYFCRKTAVENGYKNLGEMAANAARHNQTNGGAAGPALCALIQTIASYF